MGGRLGIECRRSKSQRSKVKGRMSKKGQNVEGQRVEGRMSTCPANPAAAGEDGSEMLFSRLSTLDFKTFDYSKKGA